MAERCRCTLNFRFGSSSCAEMSDSEAGTSSRPSSTSSQRQRLYERRSGPQKKFPRRESPFVHISTVYECHKKTIYGCAFNPYCKKVPYFATVGDNRISVYRIPKDKPTVTLIRNYQDPAKDEAFFTVCWACDTHSNAHVVVAGGVRGIIRVIDFDSATLVANLIGHGDAINDIRVCPKDSAIIASASKDFTARIWHIRNSACLAILGGVEGHLDQVISVDFNATSDYLASASMDHTVKLWYIGSGSGVDKRIQQAKSELKLVDNPAEVHYPRGSTRDIHTNYVDCVRVLGPLIFSKSTEDEIYLWKFGGLSEPVAGQGSNVKTESSVMHLRRLSMPETNMWFIKFEIDPAQKYLVCGNQKGEIHIWDLKNGSFPNGMSDFVLRSKDVWHTIRQCSFSPCGEYMVAVGDDWCSNNIVLAEYVDERQFLFHLGQSSANAHSRTSSEW
uniref:Uncharacterized protein n=2 Tax=Parascaris univalens TaxID=6257 RepID=A0A915ASW9_PARUN